MTNVQCTSTPDPVIGTTTEPTTNTTTEPSETTMRAIAHDRYGPPAVLEFGEVERPAVGEGRVLVRVHAAAVNPLDWHFMTGTPYLVRLSAGLRRPKLRTRGADCAGVVEAVGPGVEGFAPGDRVFGGGVGTFAEFVSCRADRLARMPAGVGADQAAALPVAAITALQGLRDHAAVTAGQRVLVNGASGGVGTFAVQIAKHMGAHVTAVCSDRNVELVRSLGADEVIGYTDRDVTAELLADGHRFDSILDNVGNWPLDECKRLLTDDGVLVMVSGPKKNRLLGPFARVIAAKVSFVRASQRAVTFVADETHDELATIAALVESGAVRPVIDRTYPLADTRAAVEYLAEGHARGKVIIDVDLDSGEMDEPEFG